MLEVEKAWAAGIVDGEGCLWIDRKRPMLEVYNTDIWMLVKLKTLFGGAIYDGSHQRRPRENQCWRWRLTGDKAKECIAMIYKYLVIKGERAEKLIWQQ